MSLITIKDLKQDASSPPPPHPQTHFLVVMQLALALSTELAPCPLPGATGANNP